MANIAGIQIEKNSKGQNTHIRINLKKYGKQLEPFLQQIGVLPSGDEFEKEWNNSLSKDDLIKKVRKHIDTLPWKK
ncbi:MAG: hypothetical protein U0T77_02125 [Chitinophagales bacterium]